jgi:hypothetical protein
MMALQLSSSRETWMKDQFLYIRGERKGNFQNLSNLEQLRPMMQRPSIQGKGAGALFGFKDGAWHLVLWSMLGLVSL